MEPNEFARQLNEQLTYLVEFTRAINELDMAASLFNEFRGMQDGGWSTVATAYEVRDELQTLCGRGAPLERAEFRQALCLYAHLAEAGGVYEGLANLMNVVQLKPYNMWPFQDMVRVRREPSRVIGPNANATFRRLAKTAAEIGMSRLSEMLEIAFRDDIRNGISHADYILAQNGLRLRRRNGGNPFVVSYHEVGTAITIGMMFFELFSETQRVARESFKPARRIIGRLSANPPMAWSVELKENGAFSISGNSPGAETDAAFERQQRINNRLGGRIFAVYVHGADEPASTLLEEVSGVGFDVTLVSLQDRDQLTALESEVEEGELWHPDFREAQGGFLLATPFGFARIKDRSAFEAILPPVEPVEIVESQAG